MLADPGDALQQCGQRRGLPPNMSSLQDGTLLTSPSAALGDLGTMHGVPQCSCCCQADMHGHNHEHAM